MPGVPPRPRSSSPSPNCPRRLNPRPIPFPTLAAPWAKPEPIVFRPLPRFARKPSIALPHCRPDALRKLDGPAARRVCVVAHVEDLQIPDVLQASREVVGLGLRQRKEKDRDAVDHA